MKRTDSSLRLAERLFAMDVAASRRVTWVMAGLVGLLSLSAVIIALVSAPGTLAARIMTWGFMGVFLATLVLRVRMGVLRLVEAVQ